MDSVWHSPTKVYIEFHFYVRYCKCHEKNLWSLWKNKCVLKFHYLHNLIWQFGKEKRKKIQQPLMRSNFYIFKNVYLSVKWLVWLVFISITHLCHLYVNLILNYSSCLIQSSWWAVINCSYSSIISILHLDFLSYWFLSNMWFSHWIHYELFPPFSIKGGHLWNLDCM